MCKEALILVKADLIFKDNLKRIMEEGCWDENPRPKYLDGSPAHSKFITQVFESYDISKGELPIATLRPIAWKSAIKEVLWIYQYQTSDLEVLEDELGIKWWRSWEVGNTNTIGQRYGATVKKYVLIDRLLYNLKTNPYSRRHVMSLWQENDFDESDGLLPCAFQTLWSVRNIDGEKYLDCTLTQRSSDYAVAGHVNMIQYVALQMMIAHECGFKVGKFTRYTQNLHIYCRHQKQVNELLKREPSDVQPILKLNAECKRFYDITIDDFELLNYNPQPQLKFELGV